MKLATNVTAPIVSNVQSQGSFTIKNSAHAFKILSGGLYSDKIKAIIRELSCNAVDSHKEAGKEDVPFTVHLPNQLESWFSVRDYGIGLDHVGVTQLYTTYFESTKQDSNDYIGALGLGSKSPFSYTDNFTVTAIKDGVQRIYSAYIDDTGCPAIAMMGESKTKECNGVEVKFSVTDRYDFNDFRSKANSVYKWFPLNPEITGSELEVDDPEFAEGEISPGVRLQKNTYSDMIAIQGNIAYPVNLPSTEGIEHIKSLLGCPLVLHFEIGELDIAASREELSYIPATVANIVAKLEIVLKDTAVYVKKEVDQVKNEWERAKRIKAMHDKKMFRDAIRHIITNGGSKLLTIFDGNVDYDTPTFTPEWFAKRKMKFTMMRVRQSWDGTVTSVIKPQKDYNTTDPCVKWTIPGTGDILFIENNTPRGILNRVTRHFKANGIPGGTRHSTLTLCVLDTERTHFDNRKKIYKKFYNLLLKHPGKTMKASELDEKDTLKQVRTSLLTLSHVNITPRSYHSNYEWKWVSDGEDHANLGKGKDLVYYLPLSNRSTLNADGTVNKSFLSYDWEQLLKSSIIPNTIKVYGVRKSMISDVEKAKNWISLYEYIDKQIQNFSTKDFKEYYYQSVVDTDFINKSVINAAAKSLDQTKPFAKFCKDMAPSFDVHVNNSMIQAATNIFTEYGISTTYKDAEVEITAKYADLFAQYPMLAFVTDSYDRTGDSVQHIMDYVNMMDK